MYLTSRSYQAIAGTSMLFLIAYFFPALGPIPFLASALLLLSFLVDCMILFNHSPLILAGRSCSPRFSNGDENEVIVWIKNLNPFKITIKIIDELPFQFQIRDFEINTLIDKNAETYIPYYVTPYKRGEYAFGNLNVYVRSQLGMVSRRCIAEKQKTIAVYPSYIQMQKYSLLGSVRYDMLGERQAKNTGSSIEFDQIKDYVTGDDVKKINWKASARRGGLMVNHFIDEKSQEIYCIIDKGRVMKSPFNGLSMLDYAINASLALTNVVLRKKDKAGLITFSDEMGIFLPASSKWSQLETIATSLFNQKTRYLESDYERLYGQIRRRIPQRSLLFLFTNFDSAAGLERQLSYLRKINQYHLMVVVFYEDLELAAYSQSEALDIKSIYLKTVAGKFHLEKKSLGKILQKFGIHSLFTAPSSLSINLINKYLELKSRRAI